MTRHQEPKSQNRGAAQPQLVELLTHYRPGPQRGTPAHELEIRFGQLHNVAAMIDKIDASKGEPQFSLTVDFIESFDGGRGDRYIRTKTIGPDGKSTSDQYSIKRPIKYIRMTNVIGLGLTPNLSLASEEKTAPFSLDHGATVRIKSRLSWLCGAWRVDVTATTQARLGEIINMLPSLLAERARQGREIFRAAENAAAKSVRFEVEAEWVGAEAPVADNIDQIVSELLTYWNHTDLSAARRNVLLRHVAEWRPDLIANRIAFRDIVNQVKTLTRESYLDEIYPPVGYIATEKADGVRGLLVLGVPDSKPAWALVLAGSDSPILEGPLPELRGPPAEPGPWPACLDCEVLLSEKGMPRLVMPFDAIAWNGHADTGASIVDRIQARDRVVAALKSRLILAVDQAKDALPCEAKKMIVLDALNWPEQLRALAAEVFPYQTDGIILSRPGQNYKETQHWKWKPTELSSVDLLARRAVGVGIEPLVVRPGNTLYVLFCGMSRVLRDKLKLPPIPGRSEYETADAAKRRAAPYSSEPYQSAFWAHSWFMSVPDDPAGGLDGKIVEVRAHAVSGKTEPYAWEVLRVRPDKLEPNDYRVAEANMSMIVDPFPFEELLRPGARNVPYFETVASNFYRADNYAKRFAIERVMTEYAASARVGSGPVKAVDFCAGRGADLNRYSAAGISSALFIDQDRAAIAELAERRYSMRGSFAVQTLLADLTEPSEKIVDMIAVAQGGVAAAESFHFAMCNFAVHYFCNTATELRNFMTTVSTVLCPRGKFLVTFLDGSKVRSLLRSAPVSRRGAPAREWSRAAPDGSRKYAIESSEEIGKAASFGQIISVKLPFAAEMKSEPLADAKNIVAEAKAVGLGVVFDKFVDEVSTERPDDVDWEYVGMHRIIVFEKKEKKSGGAGKGRGSGEGRKSGESRKSGEGRGSGEGRENSKSRGSGEGRGSGESSKGRKSGEGRAAESSGAAKTGKSRAAKPKK